MSIMNLRQIEQRLNDWNNPDKYSPESIPVWMSYMVPNLVSFLLGKVKDLEAENKRLREVIYDWAMETEPAETDVDFRLRDALSKDKK